MSPLIQLAGVTFTYPAAAGSVDRRPFGLSDLTFDVKEREILGVIGPNSAGKTTLIRVLSKVVAPERGEILLDGRPLSEMTRSQVARNIASVPQHLPASVPFTVSELVLMGRYPHRPKSFFEDARDLEIARGAMKATGILELAAQPVDTLSGGERQRAVLARALAQEPRILLLDEATAHLDLRYQVEMVGLLRRLNRECGSTILLVSHDLNLAAELADRLLLLDRGKIRAIGPPDDVLNEGTLEDVYGCAVHVATNPKSGRPMVQVLWPDGEEVGM